MPRKSKGKGKGKKKNKTNAPTSLPFGIKDVVKQPKFVRGTDKFDEKLFTTIHKHPDNSKYQHSFPKFVFEPHTWKHYYAAYKYQHSRFQPSRVRGMRILIQISTIHAILAGKYHALSES